VFSGRSASIAGRATMDTATEERCFLGGPCLNVISSAIIVASSEELSTVQ
jgi:hypothetical protein